ncbi:MAG: DUF3696 domain-containing protein [Paludibacteraceae bacterium]|nr:DUF3696 domain-containing protein [Paludibacteraceae bacterium]
MITNLSLYQFKNFAEKQSIPFSSLNIIYGSNGRGKSSMLQSVLLLSQTLRMEDKLVNLRLKDEFVDLGRYEDVLCSYAEDDKFFSIGLDSDDDHIELIYKGGILPQRAYLQSLFINGQDYLQEIGMEKVDANGANSVPGSTFRTVSDVAGLQHLKNMYFISADRQGPKNSVRRDDNSSCDLVGVHGENLIQVLYHHPEIIGEVSDVLKFVFNGASIKLPSEPTEEYLELMLDSKNGTNGYKPVNVGFGYSHVLPIIVQVLLAKQGSIVVVENPEAHLHPGAQSRIMSFLISQMKIKSIQLFIESHSDHIVNGARLAVKNGTVNPFDVKVLFVSQDETDVRCLPVIRPISISANGALSEYFDDFMDEWTKQAGALL